MSKFKEFLEKWSTPIFSANGVVCTYGLLVALIIALKVPLKYALIIGLTPLAVIVVSSIFLFLICRWSYKNWEREFVKISNNTTNTAIIENILLPLLLCLLFLYLRGELDRANLFAISPVQCETVVHPCGSSYERNNENVVWDAADLVSQPSENEVFVMTNAVFGINQIQGNCPQTGAFCSTENLNPGQQFPKWLRDSSWVFSHGLAENAIWLPIQCKNETDSCEAGTLYDNGIETGECSSRGRGLCHIQGWCPPITLAWTSGGREGYGANYAEIYARYHSYKKSVVNCMYDEIEDPYCPRFLLEDIVKMSGGEFSEAASFGGQYRLEIDWECNFDWGNDIFDCLPEFKFQNRASHKGKPKIYSQVSKHEFDRRTVTYSLGISVSLAHVGRGLQIHFLNLIMTAQFIYVAYKMLQKPFLLGVRILQAFARQACCKSSAEDGDEVK